MIIFMLRSPPPARGQAKDVEDQRDPGPAPACPYGKTPAYRYRPSPDRPLFTWLRRMRPISSGPSSRRSDVVTVVSPAPVSSTMANGPLLVIATSTTGTPAWPCEKRRFHGGVRGRLTAAAARVAARRPARPVSAPWVLAILALPVAVQTTISRANSGKQSGPEALQRKARFGLWLNRASPTGTPQYRDHRARRPRQDDPGGPAARQSGVFRENQQVRERDDGPNDQEAERGITIPPDQRQWRWASASTSSTPRPRRFRRRGGAHPLSDGGRRRPAGRRRRRA